MPVDGEANGIPVAIVDLLSSRAAASALSRLGMVPMLRALGRRRLFLLGPWLPAIALLAFPTLDATWPRFVLIAVAGFGLGLGQPMSPAWVSRPAPVDSEESRSASASPATVWARLRFRRSAERPASA